MFFDGERRDEKVILLYVTGNASKTVRVDWSSVDKPLADDC